MTNESLRGRLLESTQNLWGHMNPISSAVGAFGTTSAESMGGNYYDISTTLATISVYKGNEYNYKYNTFYNDAAPRRFQRFAAGVKITEAQALSATRSEALRAMIEVAAQQQMIGVTVDIDQCLIGHRNEDYLMSVLALQGTAGSDINDPADLNTTSGTAENLAAVIWSGGSKTEQNLHNTVGWAQSYMASKARDSVTGATIVKESGNTYDLFCHPEFANILRTNHDILDTGQEDPLTYAERLASSYATTIRPTIQIDDGNVSTGNQQKFVLTANTQENFKRVIISNEPMTWSSWKDIDDGEAICWVKRLRAAFGALARPYMNGSQAYKAMITVDSTPFTT